MEVNLYNTNKKHNVIYADPPWSYQQWCNKKQGAAKAHYETMKQKDIEELPVERIADKNCILFMWATFPKLQEALATIKAWGFEYKTIGFCWVKRNKNGSWFKGIGFYTKSNSEVCLIATKGKPPKKSVHHTVSQLVETVREEHSKKPDEVRKRIVEFTGDVPRIELGSEKILKRNIEYAKKLTREILLRGDAAITVHLYMTQCLSEENEKERNIGLTAGMDILRRCDGIIVGEKFGISEGMSKEIRCAKDGNMTIEYRD